MGQVAGQLVDVLIVVGIADRLGALGADGVDGGEGQVAEQAVLEIASAHGGVDVGAVPRLHKVGLDAVEDVLGCGVDAQLGRDAGGEPGDYYGGGEGARGAARRAASGPSHSTQNQMDSSGQKRMPRNQVRRMKFSASLIQFVSVAAHRGL